MSELNQLEKNIESFLRKFYLNSLIRGLLIGFGILILLLSLIVSIEYFNYLSAQVRTIIFFGYLISSLFVLFFLIIRPVLQYGKIMKGLSVEQAAQMIGDRVPGVGDKLTNTLELKRLLNEHSAELVEAGIAQKAVALNPFDFSSGVKLSENRPYLKYLFIPLALSILIALVWPNVFSEASSRIVQFDKEFEAPAPFQFILESEELQTLYSKDFELKFRVEGEYIPGDVFIELEERRFLVKRNGNEFKFLFKNPTEALDFRLSADGYRSRPYLLKVLAEPRIKGLKIEMDYPSHVGLSNKTIDYRGPMKVPEGTQMNWYISTEGISTLSVQSEDSTFVIEVSDRTLKLELTADQSAIYKLLGRSADGFDSEPFVVELSTIDDQVPQIEASWFPDSLTYRNFYFNGSVSDDYGLSRLVLSYRLGDKTGEEEIMLNPGLPVQEFYHNFSFDSLKAQPGQNISFKLKVWDNDRVKGPKMAQSRTFSLKVPDPNELREKEKKSNEQAQADLSKGLEQAKQLQKEVERLKTQFLNKKRLEWSDKEALKKLMEKQEELQKQMQQLSEQQQEMRKRRQELSPQDERMIEKQRQIEDLMKNLEDERLKKLMEEMEKAMEEMQKDKAQQKLEEMQDVNEELEKEMDRTLELLKQLEFEQNLEDNIKALDKLQKEQEKLSNKNDQKPEEQEKLNKEFEDVKKSLDEMQKKNEELERPNQLPEDMQEKADDIQREMEESKEQIQGGEQKKGQQSQKSSSEQMEELKDDLSALQKKLQEEKPMEDLNALRRLLENLIQLSFDQEELIDQVGVTSFNDPAFRKLAQDQQRIKDDSKLVEDSLFALSKRVAALAPTVNKEMSAINKNLEKAIKAMSDLDIRNTQSRQQYVMTSLNNLALMLDENIQAAQQAMSQQKFGEQSCSKPGQGKKQSAAQMRKRQQSLQKAMEELKKKMAKGKGPNGEKEGGSKGEMSKELSKLASEQAAIREQIRKLYESLNKGGKQAGENLKKIEDLMEQNENDLINRNLTIETIKRQEEIITRLLESEKAEREQEFDEKRESNEGNYSEERNIFDLEQYKKLKQKETELLRTVPPNLSPYYKQRVSEYLSK